MAPPPAVHIIDDDDAVRDSMAVLLEIRGMPVATYESAEAFLAVLAQGAEGCVVTDVQMPGMSGLELLAKVRAEGHDLPVIVATARSRRTLAAEAMARGAAALLEKPFTPDELLAAVEAALGRG